MAYAAHARCVLQVTPEEICSQVALEYGQAMTVRVRRVDASEAPMRKSRGGRGAGAPPCGRRGDAQLFLSPQPWWWCRARACWSSRRRCGGSCSCGRSARAARGTSAGECGPCAGAADERGGGGRRAGWGGPAHRRPAAPQEARLAHLQSDLRRREAGGRPQEAAGVSGFAGREGAGGLRGAGGALLSFWGAHIVSR